MGIAIRCEGVRINLWQNRLVIATLCCQTVHDLVMVLRVEATGPIYLYEDDDDSGTN